MIKELDKIKPIHLISLFDELIVGYNPSSDSNDEFVSTDELDKLKHKKLKHKKLKHKKCKQQKNEFNSINI